jgi:Protein of unknown function (DUF3105)
MPIFCRARGLLFENSSATIAAVSPRRSDELWNKKFNSRLRRASRGWSGLGAGIPLFLLSLFGQFGTFVPASAAVSTIDQPGRAVPLLGNRHLVSPGTPHEPYNSNPPTSGPHVRWVAPWGVHTVPIPLEVQVHNLEDGGVVVQYHCPAPCPDLIAKLDTLTTRPELLTLPRARVNPQGPPAIRLVVAPYPTMKSAIALTAWGRIETLDHYDDARIMRFIKAYIGIDHHPATEE